VGSMWAKSIAAVSADRLYLRACHERVVETTLPISTGVVRPPAVRERDRHRQSK
jgi:hypothetical protein